VGNYISDGMDFSAKCHLQVGWGKAGQMKEYEDPERAIHQRWNTENTIAKCS
jgi:hypothetical protein